MEKIRLVEHYNDNRDAYHITNDSNIFNDILYLGADEKGK